MEIPTFILGKPGEKNEKQTVWNGIASVWLIKGHPPADKLLWTFIAHRMELLNDDIMQFFTFPRRFI
jgi:hypothetical protein